MHPSLSLSNELYFFSGFQVSNYVTTHFYRIRNLIIGKTYHFRVMAENKYGVSEPASTEDPIKARHPFGTFKISDQSLC